MAYTSEIEKLEKRWAENPKGRNFAPLADAYRKAGELDRAIELCTAGLERHPDYVSAHIVFGRCLIDQKNDPGASAVFRKVLALDPENVLALKILAEIAARGGRYDEAAEWLSRLLSADPMNGDAAEALARAKGRAAQSAAKPTSEPVARLVPEAARPPQRNRDLVIEHAPEEPTSPRLDVKGTPADIETFDGTLDFNAVAHSAAKADGIEVQEEVVLKPQDLVVEGLAHTQFESGIFAMPPEAEEDEPKIDLPLIMPDDGLDAAPPPHPAPPVVAGTAPPFAAAQRAPAAPGGAALAPLAPPPAAVALSDDDGAADTATLSRAEPVLTETMAELYLRQGHEEEALHVYEALLAKRPMDARLRGRVEALAGGGTRAAGRGTGETVQRFLKRILAGRPGAPAHSAPAARSPLEDAFALAHSDTEPSSALEVVSPGEATRPATDSISLDQVFGDEGSGSSGAAPEVAPPAPSPPPPDTGGFSFDQFFSPTEQPAGGGEVAPATPEPPARSSGGRLRPPVEDEGDLDQFQAWLRGLKS
ncbi:MAG TPA: tetratricopeptide repeat protein [Gemmatimonadales bacterium]|nr:tetratricopeptide repeat protein [Gemmatimonadales bacterium]